MKIRRSAVALAALLLLAGAARADGRRWHAGAKAGIGSFTLSGLDEVTQGAVVVGYDFWNGPTGSLGLELEYGTTLSQGDLDFDFQLDPVEWEVDTLGLYLAYRSGGFFYVKGRAGYLDASVEVDAVLNGVNLSQRLDDDETSAGIGFGFRVGPLMKIEAEWTRTFFDEEFDLFTLGVMF